MNECTLHRASVGLDARESGSIRDEKRGEESAERAVDVARGTRFGGTRSARVGGYQPRDDGLERGALGCGQGFKGFASGLRDRVDRHGGRCARDADALEHVAPRDQAVSGVVGHAPSSRRRTQHNAGSDKVSPLVRMRARPSRRLRDCRSADADSARRQRSRRCNLRQDNIDSGLGAFAPLCVVDTCTQ